MSTKPTETRIPLSPNRTFRVLHYKAADIERVVLATSWRSGGVLIDERSISLPVEVVPDVIRALEKLK